MTSDGDRALAALFADLAQKFGLSRPAGHCFATIWRAANAPTAEDLTTRCGISRSGVSVALKELREWGLIEIARSPGSRRDFFVAPTDPWEIARRILFERQRRDFVPALDRLRAIEAATGDARAQALGDVFEIASHALSALAKPEIGELADHLTQIAGLEDGDDLSSGDGAKKKKKKKKS